MIDESRSAPAAPDPLGHSGNRWGTAERLSDHLRRVRRFAARFGTRLRLDGVVSAAALLHDLGKYGDPFQEMLAGRRRSAGNHSVAGAAALLQLAGELEEGDDGWVGWPELAALAVAAHHSRLGVLEPTRPLADRLRQALSVDRVTDRKVDRLARRFRADGFDADWDRLETAAWCDGPRTVRTDKPAGAMLDARMLFSCLVDADYLATEGHFEAGDANAYQPRPDAAPFDFAAAAERVRDHVARLGNRSADAAPMQSVRDELFAGCVDAADQPPGPFTLTAPTGAGKTLAMLAFALRHAARNRLDRVVFVMPFLTIIDQVAGVVRDVLRAMPGYDPSWVLEDHSLADVSARTRGDGEDAVRLRGQRAENWDAPIVLTSSVRCLEALHGSRPSACRRVHRLGRSVLLFDEVQSLPPHLATLTLATLSHLSDRENGFGASVVFATATQPAFETLDPDDDQREALAKGGLRDKGLPRVRDWSIAGWRPRPIVADPGSLFRRAAGRVRVRWHERQPIPWDELADQIAATGRSALAIVNLRRDAAALHEAFAARDPTTLHLSAAMCPAHRRRVLGQINDRLPHDAVRCVATQCVEAGVDLSFADAWRALAPLESIAQAAGRCNRSGEYDGSVLTVFRPPPSDGRPSHPSGYANGINVLEGLLAELRDDCTLDRIDLLTDPARIADYFARLYGQTETARPPESLCNAVCRNDLAAVDDLYELIASEQINLLVPFDRSAYDRLCSQADAGRADPTAGWIGRWTAAAREHAVGVYATQFDVLRPFLEPLPLTGEEQRETERSSWWTLRPSASGRYDPALGLQPPAAADPVG